MKLDEIKESTALKNLLDKPISEWMNLLRVDCQVYSCTGGGYLAKRFNEIQYAMYDKDLVKDILVDNLYILLKYKYFTTITDDVLDKVDKIVLAFTKNIKSSISKVSFDKIETSHDENLNYVQYLPDGCIAFRNGVFDFKTNTWLFKYNKIKIEDISDIIYTYDLVDDGVHPKYNNYIIQWYINIDFEPLEFNILELTSQEIVDLFKDLDKDKRNYCFELIYNMSHNSKHNFDIKKFEHLCQILGYTCLNSFSQNFIMLIGNGQNGKNSLFDGCFTSKLCPKPASIDLETIEQDRFVTGSLENVSHNFFLETTGNIHKQSTKLKQLTGSMYQSIENKGINRYQGIINCKYIFAGNDKNEIKFSDTTKGFVRRINLFEVFYSWDNKGIFLNKGDKKDYYNVTFSDDLREIKDDINNQILYVYFAIYGIYLATNEFKEQFRFTQNEWSSNYSDIDFDLRTNLNNINIFDILSFASKNNDNKELVSESLFTKDDHKRITNSELAKTYDVNTIDKLIKNCEAKEDETSPTTLSFFTDLGSFYISLRLLQKLTNNTLLSSNLFTKSIKKIYSIDSFDFMYGNKPYILATVVGNKLTFNYKK